MSPTTRAYDEHDVQPAVGRLAIAGTGVIARGLAAVAVRRGGDVILLARSRRSADDAERWARQLYAKADSGGSGRLRVTRDRASVSDASFVVEAIAENAEAKVEILGELGYRASTSAILASTTSSLSIESLSNASGRADRFVGLHVFNPVPRMPLVELAFPTAVAEETRQRAHTLCVALGKTAVEVPDIPGFVVNRLLFPFLFEAVRLMEQTQLPAESIDVCMRLGAGHPLGPLALLDLVGLDTSAAIGRSIGTDVPARIMSMIAQGSLGRKVGRGFYVYDT